MAYKGSRQVFLREPFVYFTAKVISASQANSSPTLAIAFPFPIGPLIRIISTSSES